MNKSATINSRIEPALKAQAEAIFRELGLSVSEALTLFYKQVTLQNGIPFPLKVPNAETHAAMEEAMDISKLKRFHSADEMFRDLGI